MYWQHVLLFFFIYFTGGIRVCKIRFVSTGENRGKPCLVCKKNRFSHDVAHIWLLYYASHSEKKSSELFDTTRNSYTILPGVVVRSETCSLGLQAAPSSIPTSGTFFHGDLVMKTFLRPFSLFRWFKKSSCQLLAKECALSTGKLPRRLAEEQRG